MPKHQKVVYRDNIQGLTKPAFERIARKAGVKSMTGLMTEELRGITKVEMENILRVANNVRGHRRAKTISADDIAYGIDQEHDTHVTYSKKMGTKHC